MLDLSNVFDICEKQLSYDEEYIKRNNEYIAAERAFKKSLSEEQLKEYLKLESMSVNLSIIEKIHMYSILTK